MIVTILLILLAACLFGLFVAELITHFIERMFANRKDYDNEDNLQQDNTSEGFPRD